MVATHSPLLQLTSLCCVQKVHVKIPREVSGRKGVIVHTAVVRTLQIAGEQGKQSLRMAKCLPWLRVLKSERFSDSKKSKKETDHTPDVSASFKGETLSLSVEETE